MGSAWGEEGLIELVDQGGISTRIILGHFKGHLSLYCGFSSCVFTLHAPPGS